MTMIIKEKKTRYPQIATPLVGASFLLMLPAFYFVTGNVLKYELALFPDITIYPMSPWVVLGGPLVATVLCLFSYFQLKKHRMLPEHLFSKQKNVERLNLFILMTCGKLIIVLAGYAAVENLIPH